MADEWRAYEGADESEPELRAATRTAALAESTPESRVALGDAFALWTVTSDAGLHWNAMSSASGESFAIEAAGDVELCRSFAVFFEPGSFRVAHLPTRALSAPVALADPGEKRIVCDDASAVVIATREGHPISITRCAANGACAAIEGAPEATSVGAAYEDGTLLVAVSDGGIVRVARLDGDRLTTPAIVAPCWDSEDGMCGAPRVAVRNGRFVVATSARGELRVIETTDGGRTFRAMRGIR
jgi:hypothetical protein